MPVLPDPKTFAPESVSNNDSSNSQDQNQKAKAQDFISKGPQIPDSKRFLYVSRLRYVQKTDY